MMGQGRFVKFRDWTVWIYDWCEDVTNEEYESEAQRVYHSGWLRGLGDHV